MAAAADRHRSGSADSSAAVADPRSRRRIRKPEAVLRKLLSERECRACGKPASNGHHLVPKGSPHFGDDVEDNVIPLCGSGTTGCHGRVHAWDMEARRAIGARLSESEVGYVRHRLGREAGDEWLRVGYGVGEDA
jgi:hypothetical protein